MKTLLEYIEESKILEMSLNLSKFKDLLYNLSKQIVENWCLVKWCDTNPNELKSKRLRNHWATELKNYMCRISEEKLKSGRKDKVIKNEWVNHLELNDKIVITNIIRNKFNKEGLEKYINVISEECANSTNEICNVLSGNKEDIETYIQGYII